MSTATLEKQVVDAYEQRLREYKMPEVQLGQFVMLYSENGIDERSGVVCKVLGIDPQFVYLEVTGSASMPQSYVSQKPHVRHRSDPRLETGNKFVLQYGCWDYTPWEKKLRGEIEELKSTVAKLVSDLGGPTKGKKAE